MRRKLSFDVAARSKISNNSQSLTIKQKVGDLQKSFNQFTMNKEQQNLKHVMKVLNQDRIPQQIPCRDAQKKYIEEFIVSAMIIGYSPQVLYIGGVPGIGKTLCVKNVIKKIQKRPDYSKQKTMFIYQNAMKVRQPQDIFKSILSHLTNGSVKTDSQKALFILNDYFQKALSKQIKVQPSINKILIIDQMDYLRTEDLQVIYTIVEWIRNKKSHLSIIGVSNTIDLPETFSLKIASRFGNKRLIFPQYTSEQIGTILNDRLLECVGVFQNDAIRYICKKIGGQQTDIRKCLHILRQSVNRNLAGKKFQYNASQTYVCNIAEYEVKQVVRDLYYDSFVDIFPQFPRCYKIVLSYIAKYFRQQRQSLAYSQLENMLGNSVIHSVNQLRSILFDLRDLGLITMKYMSLKCDNRIAKDFKIPKSVEQEFINLLVDVDKIYMALDAEERETKTLFDPMDRFRMTKNK